MEKLKCTQCGSTTFETLENERLRCRYCQTLYQLHPHAPEPAHGSSAKVIIGSGAKVVFGSSSNVVIRGGLEIRDGAEVQLNGRLTLLEAGDPERNHETRARDEGEG